MKSGIVFIPGDRLAAGIVPTLSVTNNVTLPVLRQFGGGIWLDRKKMRRHAEARSHTPEEFSTIGDIVAGISVLAAGLHTLAY